MIQMIMFFHSSDTSGDPLWLVVNVNSIDLPMELDTGASVSITSHYTYLTAWPASKCPILRPSKTRLCTYLGEVLQVLGSIDVTVIHSTQKRKLSMVVVPSDGLTMLGQDLKKEINLDWKQPHTNSLS